jgi:predicted nucleic acid-binding protein
MKLAVDSSAFAKRYVNESGSDNLDRLLQKASELALCIILVPEIVSGLNRRMREGGLDISEYRAARGNWYLMFVTQRFSRLRPLSSLTR